MADLCRVLVVGSLSRDIERRLRADGMVYGITTICAGRTQLVRGYPTTDTTRITMEVIGAVRVASLAQQVGAGSRVLAEGHLELRATDGVALLPRADGGGEVEVRYMREELVLVLDSVFNVDLPEPSEDATRHPAAIAWQDAR
jgi:hypothetical protein